MTRSEQFISACTTLPFPETRDDRDESAIPELGNMGTLLDNARADDAIEYGIGLIKHYPDIDELPAIIGTLLIQNQRADEVQELLRISLPTSLRKYRLYSMAGQATFSLNRLAEALVWWCRSAIAQCQTADYQVYAPFYNLGHAALVIEAMEASRSLFAVSRAIDPSIPRVSTALQDLMEPLHYQWFREPLHQVLNYIDRTYLRSGQE